MKRFLASILLVTFLITATTLGALALQNPPASYCTADNKNPDLMCMCLSYHPDLCKTDDPIPSCCRSTEEGTKAKGCACCAKKKPALVSERGMYIHNRGNDQ